MRTDRKICTEIAVSSVKNKRFVSAYEAAELENNKRAAELKYRPLVLPSNCNEESKVLTEITVFPMAPRVSSEVKEKDLLY